MNYAVIVVGAGPTAIAADSGQMESSNGTCPITRAGLSPLLPVADDPLANLVDHDENDFVVVTGTGTARDFIQLLTIELH